MTPMSPPSLCTNRCGTLVYGGGMCPLCRAESKKEAEARRTPRDRSYNTTWRAAAKSYLQQHRECESARCSAIPWYARPTATEVDHIDGLGPTGPRGYDPTNHRALCKSCHSSKTASRDGGFGNPKRQDDDEG